MTDAAPAESAATDRTTRRALLGAGVLGAALAFAGSRPASASTAMSGDDIALVTFAIGLELTARDLYGAAIDAGASDDVWHVMRKQHEAYAQRLAGISGVSANQRNDEVFDANEAAFASGDAAEAAFELENIAAATHTSLIAEVTDLGIAEAMASFVSMESRHATVLAQLTGQDDLDALFSNSATALTPES